MWRVLIAAVAAAAVTSVVTADDPPAMALAPHDHFMKRRDALRGEFPYMALVANMWGECSAVILSTHAVLGPSSCLPQGYPMNGRVEAGRGKFKSAQDFGDEPSQGRIIDRFIKRKREKRDSDSLMIMKLLEPFYFTPFVQAIHIATKTSDPPVVALVVGYGMGSGKRQLRQQTAVELQLGLCPRPRTDALCVTGATPDCRPDHGAAVVVNRRLFAVAGNESLCSGAVILTYPHRRWIAKKLREINYIAHMKPHEGGRGADIRSRSSADSWHGDLCALWPSAGLLALACALC
ncbi:uncharacterized protein LOC126248460 [Schistocerca nitens]|uniref:uncharacterized protein LOC126248460 n=1 Tax=Schistocerca nitens TaxID=7011 RepID=UPI002117475B|nr:uncharacterized protein LOC126248460 [Schistocerca nitens]